MSNPSNRPLAGIVISRPKKILQIQQVVRKPSGSVSRSVALSASSPRPKQVPTNHAARLSNDVQVQKSISRPGSTSSISRNSSHEPLHPVKQVKNQRAKRPSPAITTPQFTSSDEDEDESELRRKRVKKDQIEKRDAKRKIRDARAFVEGDSLRQDLIHAADIANSETQEYGKYKFSPFFTALAGDEDESPVIKLQYPTASRRERYQVVRPNDPTDFRPLSEIVDNMKTVAEFYVDEDTAEKITCEEDGSGMVERLQKFARDGVKGKPGAQTKFINTIGDYNVLLSSKRKDRTIASQIDALPEVPLKLVEHIIKSQIYSRTVSPRVHLVRQYENGTDNVYGELLPKFLSQIFKMTQLKSDQFFVDLGSGVGNCVLQAALETGCEALGCEMMPNCAKLADLQAQEFGPRCHLWGLKPGKIRLIEDDFTQSYEVAEALKRADVVLINNQAFTAQLNDKLKNYFLDLKPGCQIVSLRPFRDPSHKIKETNINDPVNVLRVLEKERFSGMVSWTDEPGKWFLSVKDDTELKNFTKALLRGR